MFYAGIRNQELSRRILSPMQCGDCSEKKEHTLIVFCKTFVFGIFYPVKWWAKSKQGFIQCKKCGNQTSIDGENSELPQKVKNYFNETKIPFRYKFTTLFTFGSMLFLAYFIFFKIFTSILPLFKSTEDKLSGEWNDANDLYSIIVYEDKNYTIIGYDTVMYSKYELTSKELTINFLGKENIINRAVISDKMELENRQDEPYYFYKNEKENKIAEVYRKENNQWRNVATKPQTNQELKQRVLDYLQFERKKFQLAFDEEVDFVKSDVNGPVVFAFNGFQVNSISEQKWRYLFYQDEDWLKANQILNKEFPFNFKADSDEINLFDRNLKFLDIYIENVKKSKLEYLESPKE